MRHVRVREPGLHGTSSTLATNTKVKERERSVEQEDESNLENFATEGSVLGNGWRRSIYHERAREGWPKQMSRDAAVVIVHETKQHHAPTEIVVCASAEFWMRGASACCCVEEIRSKDGTRAIITANATLSMQLCF